MVQSLFMTARQLAEEIARRQWTQRDLAKRLGVAPESVNRWINGKRQIPTIVAAYLRDVPDNLNNPYNL